MKNLGTPVFNLHNEYCNLFVFCAINAQKLKNNPFYCIIESKDGSETPCKVTVTSDEVKAQYAVVYALNLSNEFLEVIIEPQNEEGIKIIKDWDEAEFWKYSKLIPEEVFCVDCGYWLTETQFEEFTVAMYHETDKILQGCFVAGRWQGA